MTYDANNIFAKILRGEVPSIKVYEDDSTLAFMDVMPQADGHVLVIPKEPAMDILELSPEGAQAMIVTAQKMARAVKKAMGSPGVMLAQLNGAASGQSVFHVHFHVIPRQHGLEMKIHAREMANPEHLKAIAERIRAALA